MKEKQTQTDIEADRHRQTSRQTDTDRHRGRQTQAPTYRLLGSGVAKHFLGDANSTDATPLNIFNKKLTTTTVTRQ